MAATVPNLLSSTLANASLQALKNCRRIPNKFEITESLSHGALNYDIFRLADMFLSTTCLVPPASADCEIMVPQIWNIFLILFSGRLDIHLTGSLCYSMLYSTNMTRWKRWRICLRRSARRSALLAQVWRRRQLNVGELHKHSRSV